MKNGFFKKLVTGMVSGLMCLTLLPKVPTSSYAANVGDKLGVGNGTNQHKGNCDGYSYEVWIDNTGGSGSMTLGKGASFTAEWNASVSSGNFLARRGLDFGSQKKATDYPYIGMDYEADYRQTGSANGNSRLCVYGWFQNKNAGNVPLVEYYIIEDWVDWCPDANGKMVTIDGAQYKIFQMDHTGPTINGGSETFKQYFSVRQQKRTFGHITVSDHFKAWANEGWGIGNLYEVALNAEGWQSSGVADVKKLDVYTDPDNRDPNIGGGSDTPSTPTVEPDSKGYYFNEDFEKGAGDWESRGSTKLTSDSSNYYSGSKSILVTGREDTWQGAAIALDPNAFVPGNTYSFGTAVLQKSGSTEEAKLTLQYTLNGEENYDTVASADAASGKWTKLENTAYTIPTGASNLLLYVETDSTNDFYIDAATGAVKGTAVNITTGGGTVSGNSTVEPVDPGNTPVEVGDAGLKDIFSKYFRFGTCVSPNELNTGADFIKKNYNSITPENELKPDALLQQQASISGGDNTRAVVSLSRAAQTLKFCEDNNIPLRGHTFVWYSQTPDWFFREGFQSNGAYVSADIMNKRLENFIKDTFAALASEYPKLNVYSYDVCNELFLNDGGGLRPAGDAGSGGSNWTRIYSDDSFIINAFKYARKYAPAGCKLYINDYNEYIPAKTDDIYNIAMKLKEQGLIDGIGMQSHLATNYPSASVYKTALEKFLSTGLEVQITELDITVSNNDTAGQTALYKAIFEMAMKNSANIPAVTIWGTCDNYSWRSSQNPLLFSQGYQAKDPYYAIVGLVDPSDIGSPSDDPIQKPTDPVVDPTDPGSGVTIWGDANCDGKVSIADSTAILQSLGNPDKYALSAQGALNADVYMPGSGVNTSDSLSIQKLDAKLIDKLPEGESVSKPSVTEPTVQPDSKVNYFASSFDSSADGWAGRGDASVVLDSDNYYSGKSLFVSGRTDNWNGAALELDSSEFVPGNSYSFSAAVMQKSGSATAMKMTLQYTLNGEDNYDEIASANVKSGEWTKLENTSFSIPAGAENMLLYFEAPDSLTDFYVDEVQGAKEGTKSSVTTGKGTVAAGTSTPPVKPSVDGVDISWIDPTKPMVAISFDDGASPATGNRIVNALDKSGFHATFFYVGDWIKGTDGENEVKNAYAKGMEIANHTTSHPYLTQKSASEIRSEVDTTFNKLKSITGAEPSKLLRLPYLASNATVQSTLNDYGLITCSIDTQDWNGASKDQIVNTIKSAMNDGSLNGSIVLCHETYDSTASAIEELCPYLKSQGWQIVTVSELAAVKGKTLGGGQIYTKIN